MLKTIDTQGTSGAAEMDRLSSEHASAVTARSPGARKRPDEEQALRQAKLAAAAQALTDQTDAVTVSESQPQSDDSTPQQGDDSTPQQGDAPGADAAADRVDAADEAGIVNGLGTSDPYASLESDAWNVDNTWDADNALAGDAGDRELLAQATPAAEAAAGAGAGAEAGLGALGGLPPAALAAGAIGLGIAVAASGGGGGGGGGVVVTPPPAGRHGIRPHQPRPGRAGAGDRERHGGRCTQLLYRGNRPELGRK
jgi:hypothetical protein